MANTKVTGDLIASLTIATGNIADNAVTSDKISGITTAHITEGANLYYTDARADARAALLVDSAPSTLNTLNELAAALGDDPNFATTVTNSIATKLPLAGGTLTGALQAQPWLFRQMSNQVEYHVLDNGNLNGPSWKFRYDGTTSNRYVDFGFKDGAGNYVSGLKLHNNSTVSWRGADIINGNAQWVGDINTSASIQTGAIEASGNAIFAGEVSLKSRLNLQRSSGGATTLIQFKNENGVDRAHIDFGGTNEELSFFSGSGGSEHMRITSGGDIQVPGGDIFLNSGTNYNDKGVVYLSNERTAIISDIVNATANGDTSLDFQTRKGGTRASALFIDQFRNSVFSFSVGIGMTPAADAKLEIADGSFRIRGNQTHSIQLANSSGNTRSALGQAGNEGDLSLYRSNNVKHVYLSSYYNSYINPSNGNLGIGTTSPNNGKLEVQQTAITPALWVQTGGTTDTYYIADFRTGTNASALAIKGNGRVGVGESTPAEKLEVNGNIKAADTTGKFFTNAYSFSGVVLVDFFQHTNDGIWEYTLKVNPNTAGSGSYIDYYYGKIGVGIGWSGSNVTQYLWHQPTNTAPRTLYNSGGGNLGLSFQMLHSGSVYTTLPLNTGPWYLRLTGLGTSVSGEIFFRRLA